MYLQDFKNLVNQENNNGINWCNHCNTHIEKIFWIDFKNKILVSICLVPSLEEGVAVGSIERRGEDSGRGTLCFGLQLHQSETSSHKHKW